jgi:sodium transport system ATP-binding protein
MIEVRELAKEYRSADGRTVRAVNGISFSVAPGEIVGLLGANGAGKTTTMRMLATLLRPTSGTASIAGRDVQADPVGVRRRLGYVSATTGVPERLTPRELLKSYGRLHGLDRGTLDRRLTDLVAVLDLEDFYERPCGRLSSGQRQRVSLARALVHDPPVLILDEPTSGLDVMGSRELLEFLAVLCGQGHAILLSTHRLHEIERRCDRFLILDGGRIVASGDRASLVAGRAGGLEEAFFAAIAPGAPGADS